jgi:hypothetical protein
MYQAEILKLLRTVKKDIEYLEKLLILRLEIALIDLQGLSDYRMILHLDIT